MQVGQADGGPARGAAGVRGARQLDLRLEFVNRSRSALTVVRPVDGTLEHTRDPGCDLYLRDDADGRLIHRPRTVLLDAARARFR